MPVTVRCDFCNRFVTKKPYQVRGNKKHFCNVRCMGRYKIKDIDKSKCSGNNLKSKCGFCNKLLIKSKRILNNRKFGRFFCNPACQSAWQAIQLVGKNSNGWKGGIILTSDGYRRIRIGNKYKLEHRAIAEQILNRNLHFDEEVHHLNGDKTDNRLTNLVVINQSSHVRFEKALTFSSINKIESGETMNKDILKSIISELVKLFGGILLCI